MQKGDLSHAGDGRNVPPGVAAALMGHQNSNWRSDRGSQWKDVGRLACNSVVSTCSDRRFTRGMLLSSRRSAPRPRVILPCEPNSTMHTVTLNWLPQLKQTSSMSHHRRLLRLGLFFAFTINEPPQIWQRVSNGGSPLGCSHLGCWTRAAL